MQDSFDVFEYIDFLRSRWKFLGLACGFANTLLRVVGNRFGGRRFIDDQRNRGGRKPQMQCQRFQTDGLRSSVTPRVRRRSRFYTGHKSVWPRSLPHAGQASKKRKCALVNRLALGRFAMLFGLTLRQQIAVGIIRLTTQL